MKFRYLLVDVFGTVYGTNDEEDARAASEAQDMPLIDVVKGTCDDDPVEELEAHDDEDEDTLEDESEDD